VDRARENALFDKLSALVEAAFQEVAFKLGAPRQYLEAPGIGKSRLAMEYAQRHRSAYPGGMFLVPFAQLPPAELAKLLRESGRPPSTGESLDEQCRRALLKLGGDGRVLIVYDAVTDERTLRGWLPNDELEWHLIVTSTFASWAAPWNTVKVGALEKQAARTLVTGLLADESAAKLLVPAIIDKAAGIMIELCASATAAYKQLQRSRPVEHIPEELAPETTASFEAAWGLLSGNAQIVLSVASTQGPRVPMERIVSVLEKLGWSRSAVDAAIDEARDRTLMMGDVAWVEVHPLVARFAQQRDPLAKFPIPLSARSSPSALARSAAGSRIASDSGPRSSTRSERRNPAATAPERRKQPRKVTTERERWMYAGAGVMAAAVVALVVLRRPPPALALNIDVKHSATYRGNEPSVGDIAHIVVSGGQGPHAICVYHEGVEFVLRCPGEPTCRVSEASAEVDLPLTSAGTYTVVALSAVSCQPPLTGIYDADITAAKNAGIDVLHSDLTVDGVRGAAAVHSAPDERDPPP
jgi:hypothetical protein